MKGTSGKVQKPHHPTGGFVFDIRTKAGEGIHTIGADFTLCVCGATLTRKHKQRCTRRKQVAGKKDA